MPARPPAFYDDLALSLAEAWALLGRGVTDRRSPFHHPVVGTVGRGETPQLRTMVLRYVDPAARKLRVHTDVRAGKFDEIGANPAISVLAYDPEAKVQLRLEGAASRHAGDAIADAAWAAAQGMSRVCYGMEPGPGTPLLAGDGFALPDRASAEGGAGRGHFAVIEITVATLDWVYLDVAGNRRARFSWNGAGALTARWLAP